jgi:hypothetical protein
MRSDLSEGQKALDRSAAARGGLFSGEHPESERPVQPELRQQRISERLQPLSEQQNDQVQLPVQCCRWWADFCYRTWQRWSAVRQNIGNALQTGYGNAANARASGYIGAADAWNGAIGGVGKAVERLLTNEDLMGGYDFRVRPVEVPDVRTMGSA